VTAAVRIEGDAFSDLRYDVLAQRAGLADADHARGKMARLWAQCTAESRHVLTQEEVRAVLGDRGPESIVYARLGEEVEGGIRIRGTKGRIEWLAKLRKNGRKGGRPRKPDGYPDGSASGSAEQEPGANPLTPTLTPAPERASLSPPPALAKGTVVRQPIAEDPAVVARRQLGNRTWDRLNALRKSIGAELGVVLHPLDEQDRGRAELQARIRDAGDNAADRCDLVLAVLEAEARRMIAAGHPPAECTEWLAGKSFTVGSWSNSLSKPDPRVRAPVPTASPAWLQEPTEAERAAAARARIAELDRLDAEDEARRKDPTRVRVTPANVRIRGGAKA
jgi:hypothetical protein